MDADHLRLEEAVRAGLPGAVIEALTHFPDGQERREAEAMALAYAVRDDLTHEQVHARIRLLLAMGLRPLPPQEDDGYGPLHWAVARGQVEAVRALLEVTEPGHLRSFDDIGRTPLHVAAAKGHPEIAELLLDAGAPLDLTDEATISDSALAMAVRENQPEMVELLLARGADPRVKGWMQLDAMDEAESWAGEPLTSAQERILELLKVALNPTTARA